MNESVTIALQVPQHIMQAVGVVEGIVLAAIVLVTSWWRKRHTQITPQIIASYRLERRFARAAARLSEPATADESIPDTRIDALRTLDAISQDAMRLGAWHLHIKVMTRLCAYVRDAAPSRDAVDFPLPAWQSLHDAATHTEKMAHLAWREVRFANRITPNARAWAASLPRPPADIALALRIIGRGMPKDCAADPGAIDLQRSVTPCPALPDPGGSAPMSAETIEQHKTALRIWRAALATHDGYRLDLRNTNLQATDLSGLVLSGCRLDGARLEGATLNGTRLEGATLRDARLDGADLCAARLQGADLRRAHLEAAVLRGAHLQGANLRRTRMEWANCKDARLDGAELHEAQLEIVSFYKASMTGAVFYKARMDGAVLRQARLEGADFTRARMPWANLREARLEHANLGWAQLEDADLAEAVLTGADLFKARLERVDLRRAHIIGVSFSKVGVSGPMSVTGAMFQKTVLDDLDLTNLDITQTQIDQCHGNASVLLPHGITAPAHWPAQFAQAAPADVTQDKCLQWRDVPEKRRVPTKPA